VEANYVLKMGFCALDRQKFEYTCAPGSGAQDALKIGLVMMMMMSFICSCRNKN
jgi:hypothetical protein